MISHHILAIDQGMASTRAILFDNAIVWQDRRTADHCRILCDAGHEASHARVGAVFGNLSFPSASMSRYAESVWMGTGSPDAPGSQPDPRNRFGSGLPALILERALSLGANEYLTKPIQANRVLSVVKGLLKGD